MKFILFIVCFIIGAVSLFLSGVAFESGKQSASNVLILIGLFMCFSSAYLIGDDD